MNKNYKRGLDSQLTTKERCLQILIYGVCLLILIMTIKELIN